MPPAPHPNAGVTNQDRDMPRLRWTVLENAASGEDVGAAGAAGADVAAGLSAEPKTLPPKYFYDRRGSQLFERICELDEYYPTRTEQAILAEFAAAIMRPVGAVDIVELGSGSARKTRLLIEAMRDDGHRPVFLPIDVSGEILMDSSRAMLEAMPELEIHGLIGTYEQALAALPAPVHGGRLLMFLGSTIGNLTPAECDAFLSMVRGALDSGDHFLVGFDLRKDIAVIEAAYNDAKGVTAAFNLNMLGHLNRRFDGDFDLGRFAHKAFYNGAEHQIEMHLESLDEQRVRLGALDFEVDFAPGETVRTEISRKFDLDEMAGVFGAKGLQMVESWTDAKRWFGLALFRAV